VEKQISSSPETFTQAMASSPLGPINHTSTIQLLVHLISTLNTSLPDYDFSNLKAQDFVKEGNLNRVMNQVNEQLLNYALEAKHQGARKRFWEVLDSVIDLRKCEIFSFVPDDESEVFGRGKLWTMNFFFVNKSAKKIVFLTCSATRRLLQCSLDESNVLEMSDEEMFECELDIPRSYTQKSHAPIWDLTKA
jgi:hypothetical protein